MNNNRNKTKQIDTVITVRADDHRGDPERMIRKFRKLVKNENLMEELRERRYYKPDSEKNRDKNRDKQRKIQKVNNKREELLKPRDSYRRRRSR
jgi:ribosomal protein S21